jgi:hypothetical protein
MVNKRGWAVNLNFSVLAMLEVHKNAIGSTQVAKSLWDSMKMTEGANSLSNINLTQ